MASQPSSSKPPAAPLVKGPAVPAAPAAKSPANPPSQAPALPVAKSPAAPATKSPAPPDVPGPLSPEAQSLAGSRAAAARAAERVAGGPGKARDDTRTLRNKISQEPGKPRDVVAMLLAVTRRLEEMGQAGAYHAPLTPGAIRILAGGVEVASAPPPEPGKTLVVTESKYLAPECVFSRPVETKAVTLSDVYSLGFMAYEWLIGEDLFAKQFPFEDMSQGSFEWMRWHGDHSAAVAAPAEVCPWVPAALSQLIQRMLAKDSAQRPSTYAQLIQDLEAIQHRIEDTDHIAAVPSMEAIAGFAGASRFGSSRVWFLRWPGIVLLVLVLAGVLGFFLLR